MSAERAVQPPVNPVIERMVGNTGDPGQIAETARACALRALPGFCDAVNARLSWPVEIEVGQVRAIRFAEARPDPDGNVALVVASAPSSADALMLTLDTDAVSLIVASLFGADANVPVPAITRPLSAIELDTASGLFSDFVEAFGGSGTRSFDFHTPLPSPLTGAELKKLVIRDGPAVAMSFRVFAEAGSGTFTVVMPQRVLMSQRGDRQGSGASPEWSQRFGEEVLRSQVRLDATIRLEPVTLAELGQLKVGQMIEFPDGAATSVHLSARNAPLFVCEFGRLGQNYTVRVRQEFDAGQDLIEGIISR